MATFADPSVVKIVSPTVSGINLYQEQAKRIYDTAVVTFQNSLFRGGTEFASNPDDWCIFHPTGVYGSPSSATTLTINYLPDPNPTHAFTFTALNGRNANYKVNNRVNGNAGDAGWQFVNNCPTTSDTNTLFSFNIDSSTGKIMSILSYEDRVYPYTVAIDSPIYYDANNSAQDLRAASDGNGHTDWYIGLHILTPSVYFTALQTVNPMTCCAGLQAPQYTDAPSIQVCADQGLIGSTSA